MDTCPHLEASHVHRRGYRGRQGQAGARATRLVAQVGDSKRSSEQSVEHLLSPSWVSSYERMRCLVSGAKSAIHNTDSSTSPPAIANDCASPNSGQKYEANTNGPKPAPMRENVEAQPKPDPRSSVG